MKLRITDDIGNKTDLCNTGVFYTLRLMVPKLMGSSFKEYEKKQIYSSCY